VPSYQFIKNRRLKKLENFEAMNTFTLIFKRKAAPRISLVGFLFVLLSFFTISSVKAQNISELNQFLGTQEAKDLGIDRDFLYGSQSVIHISRTGIKLPEEGAAHKADVRINGISRISEASESLQNVEILQLKISSEGDKSGSLPSGIMELMPSLKVVFVLSETPITETEVQRIVSSAIYPSVKILYVFSQPV